MLRVRILSLSLILSWGCIDSSMMSIRTEHQPRDLPPELKEDHGTVRYLATVQVSDRHLNVSLTPPVCRQIEVRTTESKDTTYETPPLGRPLIWLGAGIGASGLGALILSKVKTLPDECLPGNMNCANKATGVVGGGTLAGLGATAVIYGLYWSLRGTRESTATYSTSESKLLSQHPCAITTNDVTVELSLPSGDRSAFTGADGNAVFDLTEEDALAMLAIGLGRITIAGRHFGAVPLDSVVLPAYKRAGLSWSKGSLDPASPTHLIHDQRSTWVHGFCKLEELNRYLRTGFLENCKRYHSDADCEAAQKALTERRVDPRVLLENAIIDGVKDPGLKVVSRLIQSMAEYDRLSSCYAGYEVTVWPGDPPKPVQ